jgi:hypothetical protein
MHGAATIGWRRQIVGCLAVPPGPVQGKHSMNVQDLLQRWLLGFFVRFPCRIWTTFGRLPGNEASWCHQYVGFYAKPKSAELLESLGVYMKSVRRADGAFLNYNDVVVIEYI